MGKTKGLSFGGHSDLAARVKETRKLLIDIQLRVGKGFGTSSKASKLIDQIVQLGGKFDQLTDELDKALFRDCPEMDSNERMGFYYGPTGDNKVVLLRGRESD